MRETLLKLWQFAMAAALFLISTPMMAQRVSLKSNALYWAGATPNIGVEFRLNRHFTLNIEGLGNRLKVGSKLDTRVLSFTPEARYWFSIRPQAGHFVGVMGMATDYDITLKNKVYKGEAIGAGLTYGYSFVLNNRWSLEATAGIGLLGTRKVDHRKNEPEPASAKSSMVFAPMKLGLSFVYIIK